MEVMLEYKLNPAVPLCALLDGFRSHGPLPQQPQIAFMTSILEAMQRDQKRCRQQACQHYMTSLVEQVPADGLSALQQVSLLRKHRHFDISNIPTALALSSNAASNFVDVSESVAACKQLISLVMLKLCCIYRIWTSVQAHF